MTTHALIGLSLCAALSGCGATRFPAPPPITQAHIFAAAPSTAPAKHPTVLQPIHREPTDAELAAIGRRFARAYLRWDVGRATAQDVHSLLKLSTTQIAAANFDQPPREPPAGTVPPQARVIKVRISHESQTPGTVSADIEIRRAGTLDQLGLAITSTRRGTRVIEILPPDGR